MKFPIFQRRIVYKEVKGDIKTLLNSEVEEIATRDNCVYKNPENIEICGDSVFFPIGTRKFEVKIDNIEEAVVK